LVTVAVVVALWRGRSHPDTTPTKAGGAGQGAVAVTLAPVSTEDMPVFLQGVGTVQAYQTVTVKSRVDGQLDKVAFHEGQDVKPGDLLALIDARPFEAALAQAQAKKAQDEAALLNARKDLERYQILVKEKLQQQQTLDTQEATVRQLEATVQGDQAAVDNARVQLSYTRITAPIPGRTGIRIVDPGNIVHASDATGIVVLTQLEPISVIFTLPQQNVDAVNTAAAGGELAVSALSADSTTTLDEGKLLLVDNQIDPTTGTVKLKAVFPNQQHRLWPGAFVNARLLLRTQKGATVVPSSAIQRGPQGSFVYVVGPDNVAQMRAVKVGQIQGGKALIEDGVHEGERVVVDGQYKLQPGAKVSVAQAPSGEPAERRGAPPAQGREPAGDARP
jgi:multidrug efflux system membrane fusion protein